MTVPRLGNLRQCCERGPIAALVFILLAGVLLPATLCAEQTPRPEPMVFMAGIQGPEAVDTITSLNQGSACVNTVYYDLPQDAPLDLEAVRSSIRKAADADLRVIVGLRTKLDGSLRVSPRNGPYTEAVREWLSAVVGGLSDTEGIAAWATDHDLERDISYTDEDFRAFVLQRHGSLSAINEMWGADLRSLGEITMEKARELDHDQTHGVGRPSVDLAEYRRRAFRDTMKLWAREIRRLDPDTPLMTGRISLYRSLTAIPSDYDIVQPHFPPDVLEPDMITHNVQGVQMARMGGRFDVIPWIRLPLPPTEAYSGNALYGWIVEAGLRGAVGVGLEDWSRIEGMRTWRNNTITNLRTALSQRPFRGDRPQPCAAVIYEPYAGGHEFFGAPAWGFIRDFPLMDAAELACNYRLGTIFGGLDYLTMEQMSEADLSEYSVLLMPACLSVPEAAAAAIRGYVERGGAVFADLGVGMYQSKSWAPTYSPLAVVLGIAGAIEPADRFGNFRVGEVHSAFKSVKRGMAARGTFVPSEGVSRSVGHMSERTFEGPANQRKGYAFKGPSWFVNPASGAIPLATQSVRYDDKKNPHFLGPTVNTLGGGLALFAPFSAWSFWPPEDDLHAATHGDLMRRRADYRVMSGMLTDPSVAISGSPDWLHLFRRQGEGTTQIRAGVADHRAWLGAMSTFSASERTPRGRRSGLVRLQVDLPPRTVRHCEAIAVRLRPSAGECHARVSVYAPGLVALDVGGDGAVWGQEKRGARESFYDGTETRIRLKIEDGLYPVPPDSAHEVSLMEGPGETDGRIVRADHRGKLDFWLTTAGGRVEISPHDE